MKHLKRSLAARTLRTFVYLVLATQFLPAISRGDDKFSISIKNGFIFVIDRSGSMNEESKESKDVLKYVAATEALNKALGTLKPIASELHPMVPIITFSNEATLAKTINLHDSLTPIESRTMTGTEGTNIRAGLERAISYAKNQRESNFVIWNVVLITDGDHSPGGEPFTALSQMKELTDPIFRVSVITLDFVPEQRVKYQNLAKLVSVKGAEELSKGLQSVIAESLTSGKSDVDNSYDPCKLKSIQSRILESEEALYFPAYGASRLVNRFDEPAAIAYHATGPESEATLQLMQSCQSSEGADLKTCLYETCRKVLYKSE